MKIIIKRTLITLGIVVILLFGISIIGFFDNNNEEEYDLEKDRQYLDEITHSTLEANYYLFYIHEIKNTIFRNEYFYQKDLAKVDYGFEYEEKPYLTYDENKVCTLNVTVKPSRRNPVDRKTLIRQMTDPKMELLDNFGHKVDIDIEMNKLLAQERRAYENRIIESSYNNIQLFLSNYAASINCRLNLSKADGNNKNKKQPNK